MGGGSSYCKILELNLSPNKQKTLLKRINKLSQNYKSSLDEMRHVLLQQKNIGDRYCIQLDGLAKIYELKLKELSVENRGLRSTVDKLSTDLSTKKVEIAEAREMNGIYSARLTKMKRIVKKLKDEEEESYIEITF